MKFSTKGFFSRSDQIRGKHLCGVVLVNPQIWFCGSRSSGAAAVHVLYRGSALLGGETLAQVFSYEFREISGSIFFHGALLVSAAGFRFSFGRDWDAARGCVAVILECVVVWHLQSEGLGACGLCPESRARRVRVSPSKFYPADKLQWHFTCGFDFGHSLWLPFVATFAVRKGLRRNARTSCEKS